MCYSAPNAERSVRVGGDGRHPSGLLEGVGLYTALCTEQRHTLHPYGWTEETVGIRQNMGCYYTGSKAEGVDFPGSDNDYMHDINNVYNILVGALHSVNVVRGSTSADITNITDFLCNLAAVGRYRSNRKYIFQDRTHLYGLLPCLNAVLHNNFDPARPLGAWDVSEA